MMRFAKRMGRATVGAVLLATTTAGAQETPGTAPSTMGVFGSPAGLINPFVERHPTPEQIAENAGKTVIVHFATIVAYQTVMSLVYQVQSYHRAGYRKFVIPIHTVGGEVGAARYGYELLSKMPIEIDTVAAGYVDSAGVWLYCLGAKRYATDGSSFLFHPTLNSLSHNRRSQEAAQTLIDVTSEWVEGVNDKCFGGAPDSWDLDRRDYRVRAKEAREVGLVNAGSDYFEDIESVGAVAYVAPIYFPPPN